MESKLNIFVDDLIKRKELKDLERSREKIMEILSARLQEALIEALSDEQIERMDELVENGGEEEAINAIFDELGDKRNIIIKEVFSEFESDFVNGKEI